MTIKFLCTCSPASTRDSQLLISASSEEHKYITQVHQLTARIIEKTAINLTYLYRICHFQWLFQCLNLYLFHHFQHPFECPNLYLFGKYASWVFSVLKKQEDPDKVAVPSVVFLHNLLGRHKDNFWQFGIH